MFMTQLRTGVSPAPAILLLLLFLSCSKGGEQAPPSDPCSGKNIELTATVTPSTDHCAGNGIIDLAGSGSNGLMYSLNNGSFQASARFTGITPGNYSATVRDNDGCAKTIAVSVLGGTAGPLFSAVRNIISGTCAVSGCHSGSAPTGNINFTNECNIVLQSARIKARAIDAAGSGTQMPPPPAASLSQSDRNKISEWISAGGSFSN